LPMVGVAGRQAPPDTAPPTDAFAARSAPPVPLCASLEMSFPIPLMISTTEYSSEISLDFDANVANQCSASGVLVFAAAKKDGTAGKLLMTS
jgi:hypothetical protein